ncbi:MAG: DsrE family protein [Caulobacteraceae bacterium]
MRNYLLIESQGEYEAKSAPAFLAMAAALKRQGAAVEVMLVQNGVLPARAGASGEALAAALAAGVGVWADEFSLRERALPEATLLRGVTAAPLSKVIERLAEGWNVIWH